MAKILVTGGNGFIGSHTTVELLQNGFEVVVVDNLCNSKPYVQDRIQRIAGKQPHFYQLDMVDSETFPTIFKEHPDIEGVIHFAAHLFVEESVANPLKYYQNNLTGLMNLIQACKEHGVSNVVFSSSCTVYGNPDTVPISESEPVKHAVSPYGNTKKVSEEILRDSTLAYASFRAIALRYFNPIGAHKSGLIGEDPIGHHTHLVPIISEVASGKRQKLMVFGNDYPTRDGTCVRDYIHVEDLATAHVKAMGRMLNSQMDHDFEAINIGSGEGQTVLEIVSAFEKATGQKIPVEMVDRRPGDADRIYANNSLAKALLNWQPEKTLADMLSSTWKWEQGNTN